jgi:hypothetical protein
MSRFFRAPSPALVVALVALFVALSGGAAAGTALVSRSAASASPSTSLARRVAVLETKVKALQKQSTVTQAVVGALTFWSVCDAVTTADALQAPGRRSTNSRRRPRPARPTSGRRRPSTTRSPVCTPAT